MSYTRKTGGNFDFVNRDKTNLPPMIAKGPAKHYVEEPRKPERRKDDICLGRDCMQRNNLAPCVKCEKIFCPRHILPKAIPKKMDTNSFKDGHNFHYCSNV